MLFNIHTVVTTIIDFYKQYLSFDQLHCQNEKKKTSVEMSKKDQNFQFFDFTETINKQTFKRILIIKNNMFFSNVRQVLF